MAFTRFKFKKLWTSAKDFPTVEVDETKVRQDMQALHDEAKEGLNKLMDELEAQSGASGVGINMPAISGITGKGTVQQAVDALDQAAKAGGMIPAGGAANYVLGKRSAADHDVAWLPPLPDYLSADSVLAASTRDLFGLPSSAVTNDVLHFLGQYNLHCWRRKSAKKSVSLDSTPHTVVLFSLQSFSSSADIQYSSSLKINDDNSVSLLNPQTLTVTGNDYGAVSSLAGKYFVGEDGAVYKAGDSITITRTNSGGSWYYFNLLYGYVPIVVQPGEWAFLSSSDRNAHPDSGVSGDYEYQYLGVPFENARHVPKVAIGSYTGTGEYGADNPNTLDEGFAPAVVFISSSSGGSGATLLPTSPYGLGLDFRAVHNSCAGTVVSWYSDDSSAYQCNSVGVVYTYVALGM